MCLEPSMCLFARSPSIISVNWLSSLFNPACSSFLSPSFSVESSITCSWSTFSSTITFEATAPSLLLSRQTFPWKSSSSSSPLFLTVFFSSLCSDWFLLTSRVTISSSKSFDIDLLGCWTTVSLPTKLTSNTSLFPSSFFACSSVVLATAFFSFNHTIWPSGKFFIGVKYSGELVSFSTKTKVMYVYIHKLTEILELNNFYHCYRA